MDLGKTIFISDMDETLFDDDKQISAKNREAIVDYQKKGGLFTVATGRSIIGFRPYQDMLNIQAPVILYNGSCIYDYQKEKIVWVRWLPQEIKIYIQKLVDEFPKLGMQVMTETGIYSYHPTPVFKAYLKRESINYTEVKSIDEMPDGWIKAEMTTDLVDQKQFDKFLTLTVPKNVRCLATGTYSREIVGADVSKGDAVIRYRELLDHSEKTICCIGDHNNDYEMIKVADVGIAVENALEKIKNVADWIVTDNNHDAVAVAALLRPEIMESQDLYVQVETAGDFCKGATVADFNGALGKAPNAKVLMGIDRQAFVDLLVEAIATYGEGKA